MQEGKTQELRCSMPNSSSNLCNPNSVCVSYLPNYHRKLSSNYLSDQSPHHDLAGSKYTDSDLYKLVTEKIENDRVYVQSQITYLETLLSNENKSKNLDGMEILMERIDAVENDMGCLEAEYRMAHKEFKPDLKRLKLLKNVKDFIEYLKESKMVFHSKKKVLKSQLQSPHRDLAGSKYTDSDLYKLVTEKIENDRVYVQSQITYLETLLSNENKSKNLDGMEILMERIDAVENDMGYLEAEYRMAHKEFKPDLKRLKLFKNVKDFIEYLTDSKMVFHSKKKVFKSQLQPPHHDLADSKYTDSDLYKIVTEKIENDRVYVQSQITYLETLLSNEYKSKNLDGMENLMERIYAFENDMGCLEAEYRMAHKEFKPDLKRLKLLKNVKDFIEYLKESKRVFHSKKKSSNLSFC
ncbi:hypothetical protein Peur_007266 [Populus x canadensis]